MMYLIPTENMESFEKKIARIRRKAERAKVDFSYKRLEPIQKETDLPGITVECVPVTVKCKIHYENWIVIAVLDHHEVGNVIHLVEGEWKPSAELALPSRFRTAKSFCEHCNTMRSRNKTVVIYNTQTKQFKQVGTTCLREYTGGIDAEAIAAFEEAIKSPEEFLGVSGSSKFFIETKDYLSAVVATMSLYGFMSKKKAAEINEEARYNNNVKGVEATCTRAVHLMTNNEKPNEMSNKWHNIYKSKDTEAFVEDALEWIKSYNEPNDFMENLRVICSGSHIKVSDVGFAACLMDLYKRNLEYEKMRKQKEKENEMYRYYGEVGEKVTLNGKLACVTSYSTQFGIMYIYKMIYNSAIFVWKTSKYLGIDDSGEEVNLVGTIKEHSEFRGVKQNMLVRCKVEIIKEGE